MINKYTNNFIDEDSKKNLVTNEKIYYLNDDPDQKPIEKEFVTKAYYYGKGLVPVSEADQILFKNEEVRNFKAIGFTDNFRVPSILNYFSHNNFSIV